MESMVKEDVKSVTSRIHSRPIRRVTSHILSGTERASVDREFRGDPSATRYRFRGLHFSMRSQSPQPSRSFPRCHRIFSRVLGRFASSQQPSLAPGKRRSSRIARRRRRRRRRKVSHCLVYTMHVYTNVSHILSPSLFLSCWCYNKVDGRESNQLETFNGRNKFSSD